MLNGFPPISDSTTHTLILGSMPGRDSLLASRYYAHKRNSFWPIMDSLFGAGSQHPYERRMEILRANGIGIWDVIKCCKRKTSLDSAIEERSITVNDFNDFVANHPCLHRICFNGAKAEQSFRRYVLHRLDVPIELMRMPSTSPANARMSFEQKLAAWREILLPQS